MKIEKNIKKTQSTGRKAVVKAIDRNDKESKKKISEDSNDIQQAIRLKAYELYVERGCVFGNDVEDWLMAERLILQGCK